ncbi:hypothetical protein DLM76_20470 [Leptospira yasudae]|uniref:hypothetical protein n=1 Tax=Leptospira yasudae TaxID=2202201 RepID=UPI000E59E90A|nr:hypothetical protein [Leptospira yasudae]RHX90241.1 hypothetical protein DLM76_20470 [Leptospira yasudae]
MGVEIEDLLNFPATQEKSMSSAKKVTIDNLNTYNRIIKFEFRHSEFEAMLSKFRERLGDISDLDKFKTLAIRNLLKKNNFLKLLNDLESESISEEEFESEINNNGNKYVISLDSKITERDLRLIAKIVKDIEMELDTDQVEEMFSITPENYGELLKNL